MLTLQVLDPEALDEWNAYHAKHRSQFVKERDPEQLRRAAEDKKLFVLRNPAGEIRGTCGCFEYGDEGDFREVGAVHVKDTGFGLQVLLMRAASMSEWMFDPPAHALVAITADENAASRTNIGRSDFDQVSTLSAARMAAMKLIELNPEKVYYEHDIDRATNQAIPYLLALDSAGVIHRSHGSLPITLDIPLMKALRS